MRAAPVVRLGGLALAGVVAALGQVPWGLWPLTPLALAVALRLADPSPGRAGRDLWAFGAGYFAWALQWIVEPFLVEPERYGWLAPFGIVAMAGGLALFWAAAGWAARRTGGGLLALAAWWGLAEAARSLLFTGFPWALLGHVWIDTPLAQVAALAGPHGLTLVTLLVALCLAAAPGRPLALTGLVVPAVAWLALDPGPAPPPDLVAPRVRIVQPSVPQAEKWDAGRVEAQYADLLALSAEGPPVALTVWPETALPQVVDLAGTPVLPGLANLPTGALATGLVRWDDGRYFNSLAVFGESGRVAATYDKWHLVPFGEYLPFAPLLARLGLRGLAEFLPGGFAVGPGPATVDLPGLGAATALICYEGIFAEEVGAVGGRPRLLLLVTNDAWFGTGSGPQQHFAQGRLRAIEQGLPMVRAANTGISGVIDPRGRVVAELELGAKGAIDAPLPDALGPTPYARAGDLPALLALVGLALGGALWSRRFSD